MNNDELYHHGIKGQRWGVRRFQNPDGTLTPAGIKRKEKVTAYRDKLSNRAQRNAEFNTNKAKQMRYEMNDLKKHGTSSSTYKNWETNERLKDVRSGKSTTEQWLEDIDRAFMSQYTLNDMIKTRKEEYKRYTNNAKSWMKIHEDVMNTTVGDLTTKKDIRRAYMTSWANN